MIKVYISGRISGLPMDEVTAKFAQAEAEVKAKGATPVNPLNIHTGKGNPEWADHMKADIKAMMDCDALYVLTDWQQSRGAKIEVQLALSLGMQVMYQKERVNA